MVSYFMIMTVVLMYSETGRKFAVSHLKRSVKVIAVLMEIQSVNRYVLSACREPATILRSL